MYIYTLLIYLIFLNIAKTSALARNLKDFASLEPGTHKYHETPLHNLGDVAELGVESDGSRSDKLNELNEILEDESQSPDEQSVSKYEENVKVFDNPAVLEVTSHPTDDEVKDFEKVRAHEQATEDNHFDSLSDLLKKSDFLKLTNSDFFKDENNNDQEQHHLNQNAHQSPEQNVHQSDKHHVSEEEEELNNESVNNHANEQNEDKDYVENNHLNLTHLVNKLSNLKHGNVLGLNNKDHLHKDNLHHPELTETLNLPNHNGQNPFAAALNPELLKHVKLPPVTVNSNSRNNFHFFNVHHHHHKPLEPHFDLHEVNPHLPNNFSTKECFEGSFNGDGPGTRCYCSKNQTCKCTKTYMMLVSVCDTLVNDPDLKEFCNHDNVKEEHPNLNHRFSKGQDKFVWDAFKNVQGSLCNNKSLQFCENVLKMDKLCQCTKCN